MGLQGKMLGAVRLHQHPGGQFQEQRKGQGRGGKFAVFTGLSQAHDPGAGQSSFQSSGIFPGNQGILRKGKDMGGGTQDHRAGQLPGQGGEQSGFAAAADDRDHPGF